MPGVPSLGARARSMLQVHMAYPSARLQPRQNLARLREVVAHPKPWAERLWAPQGLLRGLACTAGTAVVVGAAMPALGLLGGSATLAAAGTLILAGVMVGTLMALYAASNMNWASLLARTDVSYGAYVAMGLSLAPLVALGPAAWATVAGAAMVTCALGMGSYLSATRRSVMGPGITGTAVVLAAATVLGPTGWLMAGGISAGCALSASVCMAGATLAISSVVVTCMRTLQSGAPTEFADNLQLRQQVVDHARLDGLAQGSGNSAIFNVAPGFAKLTRELQARIANSGGLFTGWDGLCVATLHGPPGSGKTYSAAGLAQALGAGFIACDNASLSSEDVPGAPVAGINVVTLLMEAQIKASREDRPYVVLIDEVDSFLPRADGADDVASRNRTFSFVLMLNALALLSRSKSHLVVLMATNYPQEIAPLLKLMSAREPIFMGAPDRSAVASMVYSQMRDLETALGARRIPHGPLATHPALAGFIDRLAALGLTGREVGILQRYAQDACTLARLRHNDITAQAADAVAIAAMEKAMRVLEDRGSQADTNAAYDAPSPASAELVAQMMHDYGLENLDPFQIIIEMCENLAKEYSPTNLDFGILATRLQLTLAQYALVYMGQKLQPARHQEITDVRPDAGSQLFDQGRAEGSMQAMKATAYKALKQSVLSAITGSPV